MGGGGVISYKSCPMAMRKHTSTQSMKKKKTFLATITLLMYIYNGFVVLGHGGSVNPNIFCVPL